MIVPITHGREMIKLKDLLTETQEVPKYLYHATFRPLVKSIKKSGIIPGGNDIRAFDWCDKNYVYLTVSDGMAESFIDCAENDDIPEDWFGDYVILTIDTDKLDKTNLARDINFNSSDEDEDNFSSYMYAGTIPTSAIVSYD